MKRGPMTRGPEIGLDFVFEITAEVAPTISGGPGHQGTRRIVPTTGGTVRGPRLNGRVIPGGADYALARSDGAAVVTAHYALEADDGTPIYIVNKGIRVATPAVLERLKAGEPVEPEAYYFYSSPVFDAPLGPHAWLTDMIFIARCARMGPAVKIRVYAVV